MPVHFGKHKYFLQQIHYSRANPWRRGVCCHSATKTVAKLQLSARRFLTLSYAHRLLHALDQAFRRIATRINTQSPSAERGTSSLNASGTVDLAKTGKSSPLRVDWPGCASRLKPSRLSVCRSQGFDEQAHAQRQVTTLRIDGKNPQRRRRKLLQHSNQPPRLEVCADFP